MYVYVCMYVCKDFVGYVCKARGLSAEVCMCVCLYVCVYVCMQGLCWICA